MIATWIYDATLIEERPRLLAVLSPRSFTLELIKKSRRFVAHLLAQGQEGLIENFDPKSGRNSRKFSDPRRTESGLALIEGVAGWAECAVAEEIPAAERVILICSTLRQTTAENIQPHTLGSAYAALPKEIVRACEEQRRRDGEEDRRLS